MTIKEAIVALLYYHAQVPAGILSVAVREVVPGASVLDVRSAVEELAGEDELECVPGRALTTFRLTDKKKAELVLGPIFDDPWTAIWEKLKGGPA